MSPCSRGGWHKRQAPCLGSKSCWPQLPVSLPRVAAASQPLAWPQRGGSEPHQQHRNPIRVGSDRSHHSSGQAQPQRTEVTPQGRTQRRDNPPPAPSTWRTAVVQRVQNIPPASFASINTDIQRLAARLQPRSRPPFAGMCAHGRPAACCTDAVSGLTQHLGEPQRCRSAWQSPHTQPACRCSLPCP